MNPEQELVQVRELFKNLGASESQSEVMAKQLFKRADQWVKEREISRIEAMQQLLELVVAGRNGEAPVGFEGVSKDNSKQTDDF